ncbi:MAG TPA: TIGR02206 family membrane protein [Beutenbergiaceae bacterium]|nr:TIGR02206 family membrane protein [Beutenbergiaceae bacterium]
MADAGGRMELFGATHGLMLLLTVALGVLLVAGARRIRGTAAEYRITRVFGWVFLVVSIAWMVWWMLPWNWNVEESLPFHLSDTLRVVTGIALIVRPGWAISICYFWGLTLNLQSLLTPDLNFYTVPAVEFAMYWFLHIAVFLTPVVFVAGLGYRPTWLGYLATCAATLVWAGVAAVVNAITGANYGYLSRAPEGPSALDFLGPWPLYLVVVAAILAVAWALMTIPWASITGGR